MAQKRMFSKDIVSSDAFLDMPSSTQALYFHMGMEADDDGFIGNPKKVARMIGSGDDDMKILLSKRFVIAFESGVWVIKHHRINNKWDKHNCKRTVYFDEFTKLLIKENKAYTLDKTQGIPIQSDYSLITVDRIEENRIDNTPSLSEKRLTTKKQMPIRTHNEDEHSDSGVKAIDLDTGEVVSNQPKKEKSLSEGMLALYKWAESERGAKFANRMKQMSAMKKMRLANISPSQIKERWQELSEDKFYTDKGFDFMTVASSFDRKPPQ